MEDITDLLRERSSAHHPMKTLNPHQNGGTCNQIKKIQSSQSKIGQMMHYIKEIVEVFHLICFNLVDSKSI